MLDIVKDLELLSQVSEDATEEEAPAIIAQLEETLSKQPDGVGLAAIQIGIPKNVFIIAVEEGVRSKERYEHFINPAVVKQENRFSFKGESCLSFPMEYYDVMRYRDFIIKRGCFKNGEYLREELYFFYNPEEDARNSSIMAIDVQHEMDHLKGKTLPSYGKLHVNKPSYKGVGRNDKCPCGSGKKFKKCCI